MYIQQQLDAFTQDAYKAHRNDELVLYVASLLSENTVYALPEEPWCLFMQLCYNHLPKDENALQRHLGRLDTYHLIGLVVGKQPLTNIKGFKTLLRVLAYPHIRKDNVLTFDNVATFPLTELVHADTLLNELIINPETNTITIVLNPDVLIFHTYNEYLLADKKRILFIDTRKIDTALSDDVFNASVTYLQHKLLNPSRTKTLYHYLSAAHLGHGQSIRKPRYKLDSTLNAPLMSSINYLLESKLLTPVLNDDYLLLNNSWSICVKDVSSGKNTRQYYSNDNQLPLL